MSLTTYLHDFDADLETKRVLGVALERTRVSLGLVDKFADGIIARRIVELARAGERHPDVLCEGVLKTLTRAFVRRLTGSGSAAIGPDLLLPPRFTATQAEFFDPSRERPER